MAEEKTPLSVLRRVRELLLDPKKWTQRAEARDKIGRRTNADSSTAHSFCLIGATRVCESDFSTRARVYDYLYRTIPRDAGSIADFNDSCRTKHHDVIAALNDAIVLAKKENSL